MQQTTIDEAINELSTVQDYIRWTTSQLNQSAIYLGHGTDNMLDEAIQLIMPTLHLSRTIPQELYAAKLTTSEKALIIERVIARIEGRIPTPYLTNTAWFCDLEFYVDERVLIPRSPIGELIEQGFAGLIEEEPALILDLCTGSGCIGIACAYAFPDAEVDLVDISHDALEVAAINIETHGLQYRVTPMYSDLFTDILTDVKYDLIVTNPPYVDQEDMNDLPMEFTVEPELALAAGTDGLDLVKKILKQAPNYLSENGILICEVGNSSIALAEQFPDIPFHWIEFKNGGEGVFYLNKQELTDIQW